LHSFRRVEPLKAVKKREIIMYVHKKTNIVFYLSLIICVCCIAGGLICPEIFEKTAYMVKDFITVNLGWWYILLMTVFVIFIIWIGFFSKYKDIRLGKDDSKPEYSFSVWFAMLFSAGMGIGLVFWGTAEPLNYFVNPLDCERDPQKQCLLL